MTDKTYQINEIFYSLQGEGVRAGTAALFLRFSGCNLQCSISSHGFDCDTEFVSGRRMSSQEVISSLQELSPSCKWVICTGGEPLLQLDAHLAQTLRSQGYFIAVETNGTVAPDEELLGLLNWITCSPKVAEHAIALPFCNELKYVRAYGQGIPKPKLKGCENKIISPAFSGDQLDHRTLEWCITLVKEHPEWRLSIQQHKMWGIR